MKILFVKGIDPTFNSNTTAFPIGVMYIAAVLREAHPERHAFSLYDLRLDGTSYEGLAARVREFQPDIVGLTGITQEEPSLYRAAEVCKTVAPNAATIVGGPGTTSKGDERILECRHIDYGCLNEGEYTMREFVERLESGRRDMEGVEGMVWRGDDGTVILNEQRPFIEDLDALPMPAWDLADAQMKSYWSHIIGAPAEVPGTPFMTLFTSRSCPYKCTYCHVNFGKGFRAHSAERVLAEMEYLEQRWGIRKFSIADDIFNWDRERAYRIYEQLHERGHKYQTLFVNGMRTDRLDKDLLAMMKKGGVHHISVAVETATPRLQKYIRKNLKLDKVSEMIDYCDELGIYTRGFFMLGFPTETREEMQATIDYAVKSRLHGAFFFMVIPFEGTQLYDDHREIVDQMDINYADISYWNNRYTMSAEVPSEEVTRMQRKATLRFYLTPRRMLRILQLYPNLLKFHHDLLLAGRLLINRKLYGGKADDHAETPAATEVA